MNRIKEEILQRTESQESKYYGINRNGCERFELRLENGHRTSLPYHHVQDVFFYEEEGYEFVRINLPGLYLIQIKGKELAPLYEALHRGQINFISHNGIPIEPDQNGTVITSMDAWELNDPWKQVLDDDEEDEEN